MNRLIVADDAMGVPTALVPMPFLALLARCFPSQKLVAAYHHQTNRVLVNFPGSDAPTVQRQLDNLLAASAPLGPGYATWHCSNSH